MTLATRRRATGAAAAGIGFRVALLAGIGAGLALGLASTAVARPEPALPPGLEDSEPGIVALRAAGIGCAVALPNRDIALVPRVAAARIVDGGLPALILEHNLLLGERP